ncbi:MAG: hypothetical protein KGJ06_01585 [Pseudomonadota bacterium]|nr:hypothetical protein [Pseudomonadota bacterium]
MVQAHAQELLNQKEAENASSGAELLQHPLYAATHRLLEALNRLEHNLQRRVGKPQEPPESQEQLAFFERENESLRQERENLNAAISLLKRQYSDLHHAASAIYNKLDDSIRRLTKIIEE